MLLFYFHKFARMKNIDTQSVLKSMPGILGYDTSLENDQRKCIQVSYGKICTVNGVLRSVHALSIVGMGDTSHNCTQKDDILFT